MIRRNQMSKNKTENKPDELYDYVKETQKRNTIILCLLILAIIALLLDLYATTRYYMSFKEFLQALFIPEQVSQTKCLIVRDIQLPIATMGLFCGAAFGLAGAIMQTMLNNPLASPYTLGISAGASVGASIAMILGVSTLAIFGVYLVPAMAFIFALLACGAIYLVARVKQFSADVLILAGIGLVFFFQAIESMLQYFVDADALKNIVFWTMGSLERANWKSVPIVMILFVVTFLIMYRKSWILTAMRLGDNRARSLGIDVMHLRIWMFVLVSLLTAGCVAFVGCIGFIGIVGPHIARMIVGEDQRYLLVTSCLVGAVILEFADIVSKIITPGAVYPIGIITAIIGVPFFFSLLLRKKIEGF
jgi:iron complex transport system permease protein